jgi:hypothetical protein
MLHAAGSVRRIAVEKRRDTPAMIADAWYDF